MKRTTLTHHGRSTSKGRGRLTVFFSYALGAGTTTAMLDVAESRVERGQVVETFVHRSPKTGLPEGGTFDLDELMSSRPDLVCVDDLSLVNSAFARNRFRYQDVEELLATGIDVFVTIRVGQLESQQPRIERIMNRRVPSTVPDRFVQQADRLEFIDIDPEELLDRCAHRKLPCGNLRQLQDLRVLALQVISAFTTVGDDDREVLTAIQEEDVRATVVDARVLVLVDLDERSEELILEGARIGAAFHSPWQVLYVYRGSADRLDDGPDSFLTHLQDMTEAAGGEFVVLNDPSILQTTADYIRIHGISDVVMSRTRTSAGLRFFKPFDVPFEERLSRSIPGLRLHMLNAHRMESTVTRASHEAHARPFAFRFRDILITLFFVAVATAVIAGVSNFGFTSANSILFYLLAVVMVALTTRGYVPGILASIISTLLMNYFFVRPYYSFAVDHSANYVTFFVMLVISLILSGLSTRLQRTAARANYREQHTHALYELNRSLLFTRGIFDVVDASLDAVVRLFGRSAIFYTGDPFSQGTSRMRPAPNDREISIFGKATERSAARTVFDTGEQLSPSDEKDAAGDVYYMPLAAGDQVRGVLGISVASQPLDGEDRSFLTMVANQIALALERQHLTNEHRSDVLVEQLERVREEFTISMVERLSISQQFLSAAQGTRERLDRMGAAHSEWAESFFASELERADRYLDAIKLVLVDIPSGEEGVHFSGAQLRTAVDEAVARIHERRPDRIISGERSTVEVDLVMDTHLIEMAVHEILAHTIRSTDDTTVIDLSIKVHDDDVVVSIADSRERVAPTVEAALSHDDELRRKLAHQLVTAKKDEDFELIMSRILSEIRGSDSRIDHEDIMEAFEAEWSVTGLMVAAAAIRAHGGDISIRERLGGGAVTSFKLPR